MVFSLPNIVIKPFVLRYFTEIVPSVLPCPKTQDPKMDISHWDAAIHYGDQTLCFHGDCQLAQYCDRKWTSAIGTRQFTMAFSLPNIVIKPDLLRYFTEIVPSVLPCPKTQEHQSTCVDS